MANNKRKNIVGIGCLAGGIALAGTASYLITKKLVELALDRETPEKLTKKSKGVKKVQTMEEFQIFREQKSVQLQEKVHDTVEITSHDGKKLVGHWWTCENPERVIIAMHGWRSAWSRDFGMIADFLHDNSCSVLFVEQRGQNNSDGKYMSFGMMERFDCLEWIKWVNEKIGEKYPIYLYGVSMGASTVLMATGLELPENVQGIIADCGFSSIHDIWKHVVNKGFHMHYNDAVANILCREKIQVGTKEYSVKDALKQNQIPVLFIHGADDDFVPVEMTYENYKNCMAPKRILIVPGAGHAMSYYAERLRYEKEVMIFFKSYDNKGMSNE